MSVPAPINHRAQGGPSSGAGLSRRVRGALTLLTLAAVATILASGCSTDFEPDQAIAEASIVIRPGAADQGIRGFSPSPAYVLTRTKITWINQDTTAHRIASVSGFFASPGPLAPGESYSLVIEQQGQYLYRCMSSGHRESGVIYVMP